MSKKQQKKVAVQKTAAAENLESVAEVSAAPLAFGYNEMLGELEAIVSEAEIRLANEAPQM
ncbi:hypothetical protein [Enterobacter sp. CC120223-11]|uniref:hypothetical protein n=1 Tax=Enterobacter sp. CC120223-11 TaxID=1378073 RepID=UPI000BD3008A|nr:hypothetical protein [Enterobacter sp. CC120223-11]SNY65975.1 hypothetical protein SAMN02744775_01470 [Enterobacter sp. CC120223-11]